MDFKSDKGIINTIDKDVKLAINQLTKHLENIHGVTVQKVIQNFNTRKCNIISKYFIFNQREKSKIKNNFCFQIELKELEDAFEFSTISIVQIDGVESIFMKGTDPKVCIC